MKSWKGTLVAGLALCAAQGAQAQTAWNPQPWLADLEQVREALRTRYANREWLEREREVPLDRIFDRMAARLRTLHNDIDARALFDRFAQQLGDGHVDFRWPAPAAPAPSAASTAKAAATTADFCHALGYGARRSTPPAPAALPGYTPIEAGDLFPAGIVAVDGVKLGVLRIDVFDPHPYPALCVETVAARRTPIDKPCDTVCEGSILGDVYTRFTAVYEDRLRALKAAGAEVLLVDITGNGGGSEWAEAAARSLTPREIVSERLGFVRGAHWAKHWRELAGQLRAFAAEAKGRDKAALLRWAAEADAARKQAETPCEAGAGCDWLGHAGYATGLVGSAAPGAFLDKPWGAYVFSAGQHPYHPGAWSGPLIVLVDQETWSAAEEFTAVLQDNRVALVLGARTGGAGCGHTDGGTPVTLANSGGVLELPDCARFRADGSNEVNGIVPDRLIGWRTNDGARFKAKLLGEALPSAVQAARALHP